MSKAVDNVASASSSPTTAVDDGDQKAQSNNLEVAKSHDDVSPPSRLGRLYDKLCYTPPRCRYNPDDPPNFNLGLNLLFGFAACFTVANLYYNHPILNLLADEFSVTDEQASYVPTLAQAGYAAGLLFLCPLGDLLKRRPFVLWLVWFTATLWIVLCLTKNFHVFLAITFITSVTTVTPQLMLPLVGDLAPPNRRASALSIVVSGLLLGMLVARFLSGVVAFIIGWRYIYWISFGLQYLILILLYFFMPDYPSTNSGESLIRKYPALLWDILKLVSKYPVLLQACLIGFTTSTSFTNFWTTLTYLLAGEPYHYSSLIIGMFALIGIAAITWGPIFARTIMDKTQPLFNVIVGEIICLISVIIGTYSGRHTVAGPIIQAMGLDIGIQTSQIANRTAIYSTAAKARNRVNTAYMVSVFCGQLAGTAIGNKLYAEAGWVASGSASVGFLCLALVFCFARGPHEKGWIGWGGGWNIRKDHKKPQDEEKPMQQQQEAVVGKDQDQEQAKVEDESPGNNSVVTQ